MRALIVSLLAMAALAGCDAPTAREPQAKDGAVLIVKFGCGVCHEIPGIDGASGDVGPSLARLGSRPFVAGRFANTPENLASWIRSPQEIEPGVAMPDLGVDEGQSRAIAAYLETLK